MILTNVSRISHVPVHDDTILTNVSRIASEENFLMRLLTNVSRNMRCLIFSYLEIAQNTVFLRILLIFKFSYEKTTGTGHEILRGWKGYLSGPPGEFCEKL